MTSFNNHLLAFTYIFKFKNLIYCLNDIILHLFHFVPVNSANNSLLGQFGVDYWTQ